MGHSVVQLNTPKEEALRTGHMWSNLTPRGRNSMGQTQCHLMKHPKGQTLWEETKHGPMKCPWGRSSMGQTQYHPKNTNRSISMGRGTVWSNETPKRTNTMKQTQCGQVKHPEEKTLWNRQECGWMTHPKGQRTNSMGQTVWSNQMPPRKKLYRTDTAWSKCLWRTKSMGQHSVVQSNPEGQTLRDRHSIIKSNTSEG